MIYLGIVGHEAAKFSPQMRLRAHTTILGIIQGWTEPITVVSGKCPLGGVDIWAVERARAKGIPVVEYPPIINSWAGGFKPRNIQIATLADIVHVLVVKELPSVYTGMKFPLCYHCGSTTHIKSGGCWTAKHAQSLGKPAIWWEL